MNKYYEKHGKTMKLNCKNEIKKMVNKVFELESQKVWIEKK